MLGLAIKNWNMILTKKLQKHQHHHLEIFDKYENLTGKEMLPSIQRQIIEQAKFAYSPLGKAFEKQTKTIKDQGEKQIKAIEDNKKLDNKQQSNNELLFSKERERFKNIHNKRLDKIDGLTRKTDYDDLKLKINNTGLKTNFTELRDLQLFLIVQKNMKC